jgi:hypothetical protein
MADTHPTKLHCAGQYGPTGTAKSEPAWWADCLTCGWTSERHPISEGIDSYSTVQAAAHAHEVAPRGAEDADAVLAEWMRTG